jgi:hypothetical protein
MGTFATQVLHHQYIKRTTPAYESYSLVSLRPTALPRPLRAGLAWAVVFGAILTKITISQKIVRDYTDPVVFQASQKRPWKRVTEESL